MEQLVVNLQNISAHAMMEVVDYLDEMMGKNPNTNDGDVWEMIK